MSNPASNSVADRLRASRAWPLIRGVGRPVRKGVRHASETTLATRRRVVRRVSALPVAGKRGAQEAAERWPAVGELTWRPVRRARAALRARIRWIRTWPVRRDPERYARAYLDDAWYVAQHPEAVGDPWRHYRETGIRAGHAPNPVFDVGTYRYDQPDLSAGGGDPLLHWLLVGRQAGATPHPLFDAGWYRRTHPDMRGMDPYLHYLSVGRAEGRAPSAAVEPGTDIATLRPSMPPTPAPDAVRVTVIVPAYGRLAMTTRCLVALGRRTPPALGARFLLSDDDPIRPLAPHLADIPGLELRANATNLGFLRNVNAAAQGATGDWIVLLNNDTVVEDGWLDALLATGESDTAVGMVGARLIEPDGRLQEAGVIMYRDGAGVPYGRGDDPEHPRYRFVRDVDCVSGSCVLIRRTAWESLGGFDDAYAPAFFEEYDLAFRLREAGHRVVYQPACRVRHAGSATYGIATRDRQTRVNGARFTRRWAAELAAQQPGPEAVFLARERPHPGGVALVIDDRVPEPDRHAGALLTWQHLHLLRELGVKPVYLPDDGIAREPWVGRLGADGIEVLAPGVDVPGWLVDNGRFLDWVMVARPRVAERRLPMIQRWTRASVIYFTHDLHHLRERRRAERTGDPAALAESRVLEGLEGRILRAADAVLTPSSAEVAPIRALAPGRHVGVLPPFVEAADLPPADPPLAERHGVMFLGGFEHVPNIDAAMVLVRDVMPLVWPRVPDARVLIVGSDPTPEVIALAGDRVEVTGYVPDLAPVFARARMTVSALRFGAGLKGKIVTSLEAGVPIVTTGIGNEGLDLRDGAEALLGETPQELADAVVRLLTEPGLAEALAAAGHRRVMAGFSREAARASLRAALDAARAHRDGAR